MVCCGVIGVVRCDVLSLSTGLTRMPNASHLHDPTQVDARCFLLITVFRSRIQACNAVEQLLELD